MELILIRHAETDDNRRGVVHGHPQGTLSAVGKQQASELAAKLKDERITAIYSSDFQRCVDTAEFIHSYHRTVPLQLTSELQEMGGGRLSKVKVSPKLALKMIQLLRLLHLKTPGGESWNELCGRVAGFLDDTYKKHPDDTVVLVTHGIAMQAIRSLLVGSRGRKLKLEQVPNCTTWKITMKKRLPNN